MRLQLKRGTLKDHDSFVGKEGELTVALGDVDKPQLRVHDGVTKGGHIVSDIRVADDGGLYIRMEVCSNGCKNTLV